MRVFLPKGTRDFLPEQMVRRRHVLETVRAVFVRYGFEALETPAFERIETLLGKSGDESDKLMYKILKRGEGAERGETDLALRYDLTVPFSRVLAMNPGLPLPFKRYQMQPVWRAERQQKGRYREFWQCDVDVAGTTSAVAEAECLAVVADSLDALGFQQFTILLNDRRILAALARHIGEEARETALLVALDKLDKIGWDKVKVEMEGKGISPDAAVALQSILTEAPAEDAAALDYLGARLDEGGREGVAALREVLRYSELLGIPAQRLRVEPTLARGLDYYTGPVYETVVEEPKVGTIAAGGRYDGLIGTLSGRDVPAVGVALGIERIILVMEELDMFPPLKTEIEAYVTVHNGHLLDHSLRAVATLRQAGVRAQLDLKGGKLRSQIKRAHAGGYPWLVLVGPSEVEQGSVSLKDMRSGEQLTLSPQQAAQHILSRRPGTTPA